jgi:hypothetical protein
MTWSRSWVSFSYSSTSASSIHDVSRITNSSSDLKEAVINNPDYPIVKCCSYPVNPFFKCCWDCYPILKCSSSAYTT